MRVLVTGAAGFIGGYVCRELLARGHDVIGLDDFSKYDNAAEKRPYPVVHGNAENEPAIRRHLYDCDHFIAGAALIGGTEYFHRKQLDILTVNNSITSASCMAAIRTRDADRPLKKVTWLSSSMVYEATDHWPSVEGDERKVPPPLSSYGFQKLAVEYYARAAWDQYGLPYTIVRPFNCVGVGEDAKMSHVVPDLIRKVRSGQDPLHILGNGNQVRHYTYGGDLARGIVDAMESPDAVGEDFNLSSEQSTTVLELAQLIWAKLNPGKPFHVAMDRPFEHDVQRRIPSVEKARKILGWEATTTLSDMVDEVIQAIALEASE